VPSAAEIAGVPRLPPALVSLGIERARAALGRLTRAISPPPVQIIEGVIAGLDPTVLGALVALGIPDRLERPVDVAQLARVVDADPDLVARVVAYASARGWLRQDRRGRVHATRVSTLLRNDHPGGWRASVEFVNGPENLAALARLANLPTGRAFEAENGKSFFEWLEHHPDRHAVFDRAMSAGGLLHGHTLAAALDWRTTRRVCDVGGGSGATLRVLLERHPHLHGVLFDLPSVVERAEPHARMEVVAGDAFDEVPSGCDTYLLVNIVHGWADADAVRLLANTAAAGGPSSRIVVVDGVRPRRPRDRVATRTDVLMLALAPGGRERTADEMAALAERAGRRIVRTLRLASGDVAYELAASAAGPGRAGRARVD
jgi:hypothetical protein